MDGARVAQRSPVTRRGPRCRPGPIKMIIQFKLMRIFKCASRPPLPRLYKPRSTSRARSIAPLPATLCKFSTLKCQSQGPLLVLVDGPLGGL